MDKFYNTFGIVLAALLASALTTQSPTSVEESRPATAHAAAVADPIAAQGNAAVREIENDARTAARMARPTALEVAER